MEPLFDNTVNADDPIYNYIRDDSGQTAKVAKMFTESLWEKYYPYADDHFPVEIQKHFHVRFWEMYLACTLMDKGYEITSDNTGPDIRVEHKGNIIWIEATAPTSGNQSTSDKVPELVITDPPTAQQVPEEQIILRYRAAIREKYNNKYFKYLEGGIISEEDCYIIAINGYLIPFSTTDFNPPRIVRSVLPIGYPQVTVDTISKRITGESYQYRSDISKASGFSVKTDIFLDPYYKHINAVLFSNVDVFNLTKRMGENFITVHNPLAHSLPDDFLNFCQQWKAELRGNELRVSPKS